LVIRFKEPRTALKMANTGGLFTVTSCIIKSYNKWPRVQFITVPDGQVALKVFDDTFVFFGLSIAEVEHILS